MTIQEVIEGRARWHLQTGRWQDFVAELPDKCVDHVITDPPYSEHTHSKSRAGARKDPLRDGNGHLSRCAISREVDFGFAHITQDEREACADLIERVCKRWALVYSDVESSQAWAKSFCEWEYVRTCAMLKIGGSPQFTGDRPGVGFESIVVMHPKGRKHWNGGGKLGVYEALTVINRGGAEVHEHNNERIHTTQKDLSHTLELIADFTSRNDVVLDLYAGSCTTGVACVRLGRRFVGFEMRPDMADKARVRMSMETENTSSAARAAGQLPLLGASR